MDPTAKLLRVFLVDRQLRGLTSRLRAAERFAEEQERQLGAIASKRALIEGQLRQAKATSGNNDVEIKDLDEKLADHRERMNTAQTNKEYQALLTEVNTLKSRRDAVEEESLALLSSADELQGKLDALEEQRAERQAMLEGAKKQSEERQAEVKGRVDELTAEREQLVPEVPKDAMARYEERWNRFGEAEEVMACIEEQDRRRGEYTCGSCMMSVPIETVSALLSHGGITGCVSCGVILYVETELQEALREKAAKAAAKAGR